MIIIYFILSFIFSLSLIKNIKFYNSKFKLAFFLINCSFLISCQSSSSIYPNFKNKNLDTSFTLINLPNPTNLPEADINKIKKASETWFDSTLAKGFNGGMIVAKNGNIIFEKYAGTAHIPGNDVINENTSLHIASVSKTFTAMAVLKLWQDGKLNIDDLVSKYLPKFNYGNITIRNLLSHRSGLPNYLYFLEKSAWDKSKSLTNQDMFDFLITNKNSIVGTMPPNVHFSYCNTNYAILALIIETVTGKKFPEFMYQTFFGPLQMKNTYVHFIADGKDAPPSYDWKGRLMPLNYLDGVYGDKNVYTTPQDLLIWDRALKSNKIFTEKTLEAAYTPYSNEKPGIKNYGLGWRMNIYPDGKKIIFHNGWWHGSNACFIRLLKEDATIIVIGNKFTRSIYGAKVLCNLFSDYFTKEDEEESENSKIIDSIPNVKSNIPSFKNVDSLQKINGQKLRFPQKKISAKDEKLQNLFKDKNKINTQP